MRRLTYRVFILFSLCFTLLFTNLFATSTTSTDAMAQLQNCIRQGGVTAGVSTAQNRTDMTFDTEGGGYVTWSNLTNGDKTTGFINTSTFEQLTTSSRQKFLSELVKISEEAVSDTGVNGGGLVTSTTQTSWLNSCQNVDGIGSQLLTTLLSATKPDFVTAMRIYQPFQGPVSTLIGILAVLLMAGLALSMALDLAYINVPFFQMMFGGNGSQGGNTGGQGNASNAISGLISHAARSAVMESEGSGGGGSQGSGSKITVWIYFKNRFWSLLVLGICLVYLVQGAIWNIVGWVMDLSTGLFVR